MKHLIALLLSFSTLLGSAQCIDTALIDLNAICPAVFLPVCGCDGNTYSNSCEAINFGGVTSWTEGECTILPCLPVPLGVNFGMCDMALGIALTDSGCVSLSGCGFFGSDGIDYTNAFYTSTYACNSQCLGDTTVVIECIDSTLINFALDCAFIYDPVCGCNGITYNNPCEAQNYGGVTSFTPGTCAVSVIELFKTIEIFPNPTTAFIQVNTDLIGRKEMTILSISGQTILQDSFFANQKSIDVSELPSGIYFIRITANEETFTQRIIKE